jgi:hypothetical protein
VDASDRRRVLVVAALTVVTLPALWLVGHDRTPAGTGTATAAAPASTSSATGNAFGSLAPIFVDGPETPPKPAINEIVVPAESAGGYILGTATFKAVVGKAPGVCGAPHAPFGATVTVINRDNDRFVTCQNRAATPLAPGVEVLLNAEQFAMIAQLTDSPVPVRVEWNTSG